MHWAYVPRLRSPGSPASRDRRRRAGTKPSRIQHPQRSHTKAPVVCNPKCVNMCVSVCVCAVGEREASKRKENKWIGIFVKHLVNGTQRITITITITITIVRVLGRVVVVLVALVGWFFGSVRFISYILFSYFVFVFVFSFLRLESSWFRWQRVSWTKG